MDKKNPKQKKNNLLSLIPTLLVIGLGLMLYQQTSKVKNSEILSKDEVIAELKEKLAERDLVLEAAYKSMAQKDTLIAVLTLVKDQYQSEAEFLNNRNELLQHTVNSLEKDKETMDRLIRESTKELATLRQDNYIYRQRIKQQQEQADQLVTEISRIQTAMKNSPSGMNTGGFDYSNFVNNYDPEILKKYLAGDSITLPNGHTIKRLKEYDDDLTGPFRDN
jgi:chromosome segregation ATPase